MFKARYKCQVTNIIIIDVANIQVSFVGFSQNRRRRRGRRRRVEAVMTSSLRRARRERRFVRY